MLPIVAYGHSTLRKISQDIDKDYPELDKLIQDMFETMYESVGVGLAAPQVNRSIRLFIIDATPYADDIPEAKDFKKVFINARIVEQSGSEWVTDEGCLSIPNIREDVARKEMIRIQYYDQNWEFHDETHGGYIARIIQHEYDHLEGILFTDKINPLRKTLIRRRLNDISRGDVKVDYKMIFPAQKKKLTRSY